MRGNLAEKITLAELTSACATTERTLLKQFRKFVGLSPLAFLRRLRLNAARSELQRGTCDTAVSEVAAVWCFSHLGRFATVYRRAFGESPSMTRQRVRGDGPDTRTPGSGRVVREAHAAGYAFRTETLREQFEARDLSERLGATLSCMRNTTDTLVHPSRAPSFNAKRPFGAKRPVSAGRQRRWRHPVCPDEAHKGALMIARASSCDWSMSTPTAICGATVSMALRAIRSACGSRRRWRAVRGRVEHHRRRARTCSTRIPGSCGTRRRRQALPLVSGRPPAEML